MLCIYTMNDYGILKYETSLDIYTAHHANQEPYQFLDYLQSRIVDGCKVSGMTIRDRSLTVEYKHTGEEWIPLKNVRVCFNMAIYVLMGRLIMKIQCEAINITEAEFMRMLMPRDNQTQA